MSTVHRYHAVTSSSKQTHDGTGEVENIAAASEPTGLNQRCVITSGVDRCLPTDWGTIRTKRFPRRSKIFAPTTVAETETKKLDGREPRCYESESE